MTSSITSHSLITGSLTLAAGGHGNAHGAEHASNFVADPALPFLLVIPLLLGALMVPAIGLWRPKLTWLVAMSFTTLFSALSIVGLVSFALYNADVSPTLGHAAEFIYRMGGWDAPKGIVFRYDLLSGFVLAVLGFISFWVVLFSKRSVPHELPGRQVPFYGVMFVMLLGLVGMVSTGDLFNLYVFFEVSSIGGYALMAMGSRQAPVSAYRYLIMGTVGASFYLLGLGFLYALTGSLNMVDVAARIGSMEPNGALILSAVLIVTGVGLKMAMFPMHLWLPDAYSYASSTATAIIAPVMTKVSAYVLIRMLYFVYQPSILSSDWPLASAITWLSLIGIVVGSVMAIAQKDIKRMLAYSSVAQVAYIGLGIGLVSKWALVGALLHVVNHAVMKCALFLVSGGIYRERGTTRIHQYTSLARYMPWTFFGFTMAAIGMVGLPPTNGFFSKFYLVMGATGVERWMVLVALIFSGLLTATYFFKLLTRAYTDPRPEDGIELTQQQAALDTPWSMRLPILALGTSVLLLGLFNVPLVRYVLEPALPQAMGGAAYRSTTPLELPGHVLLDKGH